MYATFPRLRERRTSRAGYTSGGEQQMLAIGRALMTSPELVLLDEPSMGLAPQVVDEIFEIVAEPNRASRVSFLIAEQNASLALEHAHHAYVIENGRVEAHGSAAEIDRPAAGLLADLKQRGLLDSTLVIWGGEFGRTVTRDRNGNDNPGRDHNNSAFSLWLAGGGVRGGTVYGATDEFGAKAVKDPVHIHDLHATILHLLGFDHTRLTYRYNGRDFRLTDNAGTVVKGILA